MAPVVMKNSFNKLKIPLDFNIKFGKDTIFGKNKTFRGLIFGIVFGVITAFIQSLLYNFEGIKIISFLDYSNWLLLGFLMGLGAIIGDLIESFFKRRFNIKSGKPFIPFDQLDFMIGAMVFVYPVFQLNLNQVITLLVLSFFLHILVNHIAFYLKIRKEKW
ncbi:MAG: CDP-archaeol synthase [Spirochaetes bacterium]|nr:CDP-archaeol synthase [Spirochaetota bacterium]